MNRKKSSSLPVILTALIVVVVLALTIVIAVNGGKNKDPGEKGGKGKTSVSAVEEKEDESETDPEEVVAVSSAKIGSAGDILIHKPILSGAYSNGSYDFSDIFTYVSGTIKGCDYFIANLEVTLGGAERGYSTYPCFNIPDSIVDAAKNAGIDCLLTANNHCYDSSESGLLRTLNVLNEKKIDHTGTRLNESEKKYFVKEVNGIKLGILCYTYETESSSGKAINGILTSSTGGPRENIYNLSFVIRIPKCILDYITTF